MKQTKFLSTAVAFVFFTVIAGTTAWWVRSSTPNVSDFASVAADEMTEEELEVARETVALQQLVEESLTWRAKAVAFIRELKANKINNEARASDLTQRLHKGVLAYKAHRDTVLKLAEKYAWLADLGDEGRTLVLAPDRRTENDTPEGGKKIRINPLDRHGQLATRRLKVSLAAAMTLFDNYLVAAYPYQKDGELRRLMNGDNTEVDGFLDEMTNNYVDRGRIFATQRAVLFFEKEQSWLKERNALSKDPHVQYLDLLIRGSLSYETMRDYRWYKNIWERITSWRMDARDGALALLNSSMNSVSKVFGNASGAILVENRKGKLYGMEKSNPAQFKAMKARLKPLDILLEKTPFRLTDKFIPGHYGHVAIWVGTKEELQALGLWDDLESLLLAEVDRGNEKRIQEAIEKAKRIKAAIEKGHHIVEALRPGVQLNTLEHFLDIDDFASIRHEDMTQNLVDGLPQKGSPAWDRVRQRLIVALKQIGKDYDFNFDVESDKKIVCSELAYVVFATEKWPAKKSVGRFAISPDQVAVRATDGGPFEVVDVWTDGKYVQSGYAHKTFVALLEGSKPDFAQMEVLVASSQH